MKTLVLVIICLAVVVLVWPAPCIGQRRMNQGQFRLWEERQAEQRREFEDYKREQEERYRREQRDREWERRQDRKREDEREYRRRLFLD